MRPAAVEEAARAAGRHVMAPPVRVSLDLPADRCELLVPRAIYLAYTRDEVLHYVGKVDRARGTALARLGEHLQASRRKQSAWRTLWVVVLGPTMPVKEIVTLERALIRAHRPISNVQHTRAA